MTVPFLSLVPLLLALALLAIVRPSVALTLPLALHASYLVRSQVSLGGFVVPTTLLELLLWVAVLFGVVRQPRAIVRALRTVPREVIVLVALFVLAATVSAAIAPHPRTAWGQWKAFVVEPLAYAVALLPLLRSKEGRNAVASALLLGGIVSVILSVAVGTRTPDFGRLRGPYDVPNSLALVLAPLTAFAAVLTWGSEHSTLRRLSRASLFLFVPALLLTQSLGGLIAALVGAGAALFVAKRQGRASFSLARVAVVLCALVAAGFAFLYSTGKLPHALAPSSPAVARLQIWQASLALVRDHPVLGTGLGTFEPAYQAKLGQLLTENSEPGTRSSQFPVPGPQFPLEWLVRDPHNVVLSFWLHTGLLGLLSMAGLVVLALRGVYKLHTTSYKLASGTALLALLVFGLVDVPYLKNDLALLWWAYLAVVALPP